MTIGFRAIRAELVSHAERLGVFDRVGQHEPANAPGNGLSAWYWLDRVRPDPTVSGLASTSAVVVFNARLATSMTGLDGDEIDPNLVDALDALFASYHLDFSLNSSAMHIDLLGRSKVEILRSEAGYFEQDGQVFRAFMVWIPVVIADAWTQAP